MQDMSFGTSNTSLKRLRRSLWGAGAALLILLLLGGVAADNSMFTLLSTASGADDTLTTDDETLDDPADTSGGGGSSTQPPSDGDPNKRRTLLTTLWDGGIVGALIIILSFVTVTFIVEHFLTIRKPVLMPETVLEDLEQLIAAGQVDEAVAYCQEPQNASLATNCVLAGLERFQGSEFGFAEYKAAVEEAGEDQTARLYRKTEVLGLIGSIAPMLGLTGTVLGMINAFNTIAASGGMAKPDELAGGIGQALVTTLLGLIVAIPAMIAFSFFRNQIDSIVAEAGKRIERIMMPLGRQK